MTGFWTDCINPFNNPVKHGFWSNNQIYAYSKLCPVCWYKAGGISPVYVPTHERPKNSRIDSKPEKDSL